MKIAIIGAGASGLLLASKLTNTKIEYDIFNDGKIASKLLASGNGKCNISNRNLDKKYYHNSKFYNLILSNQDLLFKYFEELGIYTKADNEGRMYPYSESSQSVLNALMLRIKKDIIDKKIISIEKNNDSYYLNNQYGPYDKLIFATGSCASIIKNKALEYNSYLNSLNLNIKPFKPSLVGFKIKEKISPIAGVRAKCIVSLYNGKKLIHSEEGEIIFKEDGISGICVMNLSSYYTHLEIKDNPYLVIDLAPRLCYDNLICILNPKLLAYKEANKFDIHKMVLSISKTYSLENAQVSSGGIEFNEFNDDLSLKKDHNLYAMGELLDIDGVCGGYNLMSAFCSALVVYRSLENEI